MRFYTDTRYYNDSYVQLINIGSKLKSGEAKAPDVVDMVSGLLAWNQGAKHAKSLSSVLDQYSSGCDSSFNKLISRLKAIESDGVYIENSKKVICEVLMLSQQSLNLKSVVMPSKLIHFISPRYFAMTDSNVSRGIAARTNSKNGYIKYIQKLWELGFHHNQPRDVSLVAYWGESENVSPMRAIDCTFYALGKKNK